MLSKEHSYLIVGCGHFGRLAIEKLLRKGPRSKITTVDKNRSAVQKVSQYPVEAIVRDGQDYLDQVLAEGRPFDYIIPAVPYHLVFEFLLKRLKRQGAKRGQIPPLQGIPNPMIGKQGDLYSSLANFLCPEDCPEPARHCTVTGKSRLMPLCKILENLSGPFDSRVIRSQQLGLGVGGFQPKMLLGLLDEVERKLDSHPVILISTACRCHGVTSALTF